MSSAFIFTLIWASIVLVFLYLLGTTAVYLIGHSKRDSIRFKNFNYKIQFFEVNMSIINESIFILFEVMLSIFVLYLVLTTRVELRLYWMNALIVLGLTIATHLIWRILKGMDQNMVPFYKNYQIATGALQKKEEAEHSVDETRMYRKNIVSLINQFEKQIKTVTDPNQYHLRDSISIIDQFVSEQTKTLNQYEQDVVSRFDKTVEMYYENGNMVLIELPSTSIDFEKKFNNVRSDIYNKYNQIFNDTLYDLIASKKFITANYITKGLQILKDNEYSPRQDLIELILMSIDEIEGSPRELIDYITSKKIIELEILISYAINKKIVWVFKTNVFETQEQLSTVSERLIKEDAYNLAIAFISSYFSRLQNVLAFMEKIVEKNNTMRLFQNYQKVMNVEQSFYAEHKVYENKIYSLVYFFEGKNISPAVQSSLEKIKDVTKAYQNSTTIDNMYDKVQERFEELRSNAIQSLLMYSGISSDKSLFDLKKTSQTINDYYNRLMVNDLILASLLLYSLFLKHNTEEALHDDVIHILKNDPRYFNIVSDVGLDMGFEYRVQIGNKIIRDVLLRKERARLSNIVLKIEKDRRTIDVLTKS